MGPRIASELNQCILCGVEIGFFYNKIKGGCRASSQNQTSTMK